MALASVLGDLHGLAEAGLALGVAALGVLAVGLDRAIGGDEAPPPRLGLAEHGAFLGWIGDDLLHSLYRIADLCVVPSLYEPFGLVALDAMASGCPCIVADTGGLREVVQNDDDGLRFRSRDPRSLAGTTTLVLANPAVRYRLVSEASGRVARVDWTDGARRTAAVYGALGEPRSRPRATRRPAAVRR